MARPARIQGDLWKVTLLTVPEAEDLASEVMERRLGQASSAYLDFDTGSVTVAIYLQNPPPDWTGLKAQVQEDLGRAQQEGIQIGPAKLSLERIRASSWVDSWKKHFKAFEIGSELLVRPSWSRKRPQRGQAVLIIDPGLSFGTGHHPTTRFCLEQIVYCRNNICTQSLLDVGTGTGILAMAAAQLGYASVDAFDFDPEAIRVASENVQVNRLAEKVRVQLQDLVKMPSRPSRSYGFVCANLIANLLISERRKLIRRVEPAGFLVLAGILNSEFSLVKRAYESDGMTLVRARTDGEWRSGCFQRFA